MNRFITIIAISILFSCHLFAQYEILGNFGVQPDARNPDHTSFVSDGSNLYGMSHFGGTSDLGTIFKMDMDGSNYTVLHNFAGGSNDGKLPNGSLIISGSDLYGMTSYGGTSDNGTIFKITTSGTYTQLYSFASGVSGTHPYGSLLLFGSDLYGMTSYGGTSDYGTIFKITTSGTFTHLYDFAGGLSSGRHPYGSLTISGNDLFGMTYEGGGSGRGTIFKITTSGTYTHLYNFLGGASSGRYPYGSLTISGNDLFGMTYEGGSSNYGTIFKITTSGTYTHLYSFSVDGAGIWPRGSLIISGSDLYGMTPYGGTSDNGTIFKITTSGTYTHLYSFSSGASSGRYPYGSLLLSGTDLYGMTNQGGISNTGQMFRYRLLQTPTLTTVSISNISYTGASSGGNISSDGGATVTARGIVWSTTAIPTLTTNEAGHTTNGTGTGAFTSAISGLTYNTLYYVRAYATNSVGTAYGNEITFTTIPTLGEWGLIAMGILFAGFGGWFVWRRIV